MEAEPVYEYYVDFSSDEEQGPEVESRIDCVLNDLEVLFQEQLAVLAKDAAKHHRKEKGKAIITELEPQ